MLNYQRVGQVSLPFRADFFPLHLWVSHWEGSAWSAKMTISHTTPKPAGFRSDHGTSFPFELPVFHAPAAVYHFGPRFRSRSESPTSALRPKWPGDTATETETEIRGDRERFRLRCAASCWCFLWWCFVPSGYVKIATYWKWPVSSWIFSLNMVIFHSSVDGVFLCLCPMISKRGTNLWGGVRTPAPAGMVEHLYQLIGLREKIRKVPYFMGKTMVSCRFSLQLIHSLRQQVFQCPVVIFHGLWGPGPRRSSTKILTSRDCHVEGKNRYVILGNNIDIICLLYLSKHVCMCMSIYIYIHI